MICDACGTLYKRPDDLDLSVGTLYLNGYETQFDVESVAAAEAEMIGILKEIAELHGKTGRILDIGCGPGHFLRLARQVGFDPYGVEINPVLAEKSRATVGAHIFVGSDALAQVEASNLRFDVVSILDLIEHVQDPLDLMRSVRRVLAPGGLVAVFTPNHASLIVGVARMLYGLSGGRLRGPLDKIFDSLHVTYFDRSSLAHLLSDLGYRLLRTRMVTYKPERRNQAQGISAIALRAIESISPLLRNGPFRVLALASSDAPEQTRAGAGHAITTA